MPNWCSNTIEIEGTKEQINAFVSFLDEQNGKEWFSFFKPTPPELKVEGWYEWNIENWGTKWNCDAQDWVKVENPNEDYEAVTPFIKLWCKDSKQNSNTQNPYGDGLNLGSDSFPPLSEDLGTEIILLPRDMEGPMKCENPGLFVKSYNGTTKAAKKNGFVSSLFFPLNKLLLINPNVLNLS